MLFSPILVDLRKTGQSNRELTAGNRPVAGWIKKSG
jgi:hypothetical protein